MERTILEMPTDYSLQVEAIAPINQNEYYLSTENSFSGAAGLFRYTASIALAETANNCEIKYLSKKNIIKTECILFSRSELYSIHGGLVSMSNHPHLDTSTIDSGLYIFVVKDSNNKIKHTQKVIIQ